MSNQVGGYIAKIIFNNNEMLDIAKNDIVVFVGPNNAGKSQSLKDIYMLSSAKTPSKVVSDIVINKYVGSVKSLLDKIAKGIEHGQYTKYELLGHHWNIFSHTDEQFQDNKYFDILRDLFVVNLDTSARLSICNPPANIPRNAVKQHPIHYAAFGNTFRKWLSDNYRRAFGADITPNIQNGATIPLCIGNPVTLEDDYEDEQSRQEAYADILDAYPQVQAQGDGIKSFTGILLYLMLNHYCVYLLDEPESFLHPPQAYIMGQIIGRTLSDSQQAFISTHSEEIVKGLLEACPGRVKLVRITREGDMNSFSILNNKNIQQLWGDSLLRHSNIMSSLFHKTVVLCESDSDCKLYSIIDGYLKQEEDKYSETLFTHCGGKYRLAKVIVALKALALNIKVIADIDLLNDKKVFKATVESLDIKWHEVEKDYEILSANLHSPNEKVDRKTAKLKIERLLESSQSPNLTREELKEIRAIVATASKWDNLKKCGIAAIPPGDATEAFERIDHMLKKVGLFLVPVGEIENFIKDVGGHGQDWVNTVLEKHCDLGDKVFSQIKDFVREMQL